MSRGAWPDKHLGSIGWELDENMCIHCPLTGNSCPFNHRMSPVDLVRDRAIEDHSNWKECPDWHWMNFEDGSCDWDDMRGHFEISRHALQIHTPQRSNGDIDCSDSDGSRKYPRLDYSKGFPDWWHLDRTDIKVPSEHTQHGKRYAAEVSLAHFYEIDHYKNQIGYVTLFLQDYPGERPWHYLDKLICEFRRIEEKRRAECGLPPAPVYKMCELYRGQERTPEDMEYFQEEEETEVPNGQLEAPPARPLEDFGGNPDAKHFPLQLCQGDCDFTEDCAPGLICHRREANEEVPGCIGGADLDGGSDFCIFDPFGEGYFPPTDTPSAAPTSTPKPTIAQLPPRPLIDFGGTPPIEKFPLRRCEGDCDTDEDCMDGLVCFQRNGNQTVPGCTAGDFPMDRLTDFCILDPFGSGYVDPPTEAPTSGLQPPSDLPTVRPATDVPATTGGEPSVSPTYFPRPVGPPKEVWNRGWEPAFQLGECEGDCDDDGDCLPGLICFEREAARVAVPGCAGGETDDSLTDYCVYPDLPDGVLPGNLPGADDGIDLEGRDDTPTASPVVPPTNPPTDKPTVSENALPLNPIGWSPPDDQKPLGLCEGDCDDDDDCGDGLVCFQRFLPMTAVPGCAGGKEDTSLMDFCIRDPNAPATEAPAPTEAPALVVPSPGGTPPGLDDVVVGRTEPVSVDCQKHGVLNIARMCFGTDPCCQNPRSASNFCHEMYDVWGDEMDSACHHCCMETDRQEHLEVGPPNDPHPDGLVPYESCDALANTARLCKANSCCDEGFADTDYCNEQWALHRGDVTRICWTCCFPSKSYSEPGKRRGLSGNNTINISDGQVAAVHDLLEEKVDYVATEEVSPAHTAMTEQEMRLWHKNNPPELRPGDKMFEHSSMKRKLIVREENFGGKGEKDEDAYFEEIHSAFQRRELQEPLKENYADVYWWPYEWLLKVGTEYYFRYEGSMTVPPCYTVNHWRVLKDPIRVAEHQIKELERLLAWRMNGNCDASTAGKARDDNPDAVDVNRPLQELERGHRMVFCECQDWPSKFPKEREWCKKWQTRDPELRLFDNPYNWAQNGF
ncbi:MAG: hypothetical protein SGILL_008201 [Bacillariaceae sp.]